MHTGKEYHSKDHNTCPQCHETNENEIHYFLFCTNYAAHCQHGCRASTGATPAWCSTSRLQYKKNIKWSVYTTGHVTGTPEVDAKIF